MSKIEWKDIVDQYQSRISVDDAVAALAEFISKKEHNKIQQIYRITENYLSDNHVLAKDVFKLIQEVLEK